MRFATKFHQDVSNAEHNLELVSRGMPEQADEKKLLSVNGNDFTATTVVHHEVQVGLQ